LEVIYPYDDFYYAMALGEMKIYRFEITSDTLKSNKTS